ncbi:unannotated protein [freshwater metagenome]|uniref:Unannotated protein n=1 Tax=freshwater metagenome TaxID=449393 RepID=A0A6J7NTN8_9ZZZZ
MLDGAAKWAISFKNACPVPKPERTGFAGFPTRTVAVVPEKLSTTCGKPVAERRKRPYSSVSNKGTS